MIQDIATHDQSHYRVSVQRNLSISWEHEIATELQLSLICRKDQMDSFLREHPKLFKDLGFHNGVAIVARISSIRTSKALGKGGENEDVKIGDGELIEIIYIGDIM